MLYGEHLPCIFVRSVTGYGWIERALNCRRQFLVGRRDRLLITASGNGASRTFDRHVTGTADKWDDMQGERNKWLSCKSADEMF